MRRVAIALVVVFGLAPTAAAATKPPKPAKPVKVKPAKVTASGMISALDRKSITVRGAQKTTCRVVSISPKALGFHIGTKAKVVCIKGVLEGISRTIVSKTAAAVTEAVSSSSTSTSTSSNGTSTATSTSTAVSAVISGDTARVSGKAALTAVGNGTVSFGNRVTCTLGGDSPDVGGFKVGDRVSFRCAGPVPPSFAADPKTNFEQLFKNAGTLTSIEPAT